MLITITSYVLILITILSFYTLMMAVATVETCLKLRSILITNFASPKPIPSLHISGLNINVFTY